MVWKLQYEHVGAVLDIISKIHLTPDLVALIGRSNYESSSLYYIYRANAFTKLVKYQCNELYDVQME